MDYILQVVYSVIYGLGSFCSFGRVYYSISNGKKTGTKNVFPFFTAIQFVAIGLAQAVYTLAFWFPDKDYIKIMIVLCQTIAYYTIYITILYKAVMYAKEVELNAVHCSSKFEKLIKEPESLESQLEYYNYYYSEKRRNVDRMRICIILAAIMVIFLIFFLVSDSSRCIIYQFSTINNYDSSKFSCEQIISFSSSINIWIFKIVLRTIEMAVLLTAIYSTYKYSLKYDQYFIQYEIYWTGFIIMFYNYLESCFFLFISNESMTATNKNALASFFFYILMFSLVEYSSKLRDQSAKSKDFLSISENFYCFIRTKPFYILFRRFLRKLGQYDELYLECWYDVLIYNKKESRGMVSNKEYLDFCHVFYQKYIKISKAGINLIDEEVIKNSVKITCQDQEIINTSYESDDSDGIRKIFVDENRHEVKKISKEKLPEGKVDFELPDDIYNLFDQNFNDYEQLKQAKAFEKLECFLFKYLFTRFVQIYDYEAELKNINQIKKYIEFMRVLEEYRTNISFFLICCCDNDHH